MTASSVSVPETSELVVGVAASVALVALAVALSTWRRLGLGVDILVAVGRAAAQLIVVGGALHLVVDPDAPVAWAWVWVAGMVVFAATVVRRRASEAPGLFRIALLAVGLAAGSGLAVIFGSGTFDMEGRSIVPLAGMIVGNSLGATVVAARRVVEELSDKRLEVEARLALGQPWQVASRPYVRAALRTAMLSQVEQTKAVGLVLLPGAMTGLVLAGVDPVDAVIVQLIVMYLILGSVAITATVVGVGLTRRLFTADHRLVRLERAAT